MAMQPAHFSAARLSRQLITQYRFVFMRLTGTRIMTRSQISAHLFWWNWKNCLCRCWGLRKQWSCSNWGQISLDGTKNKANASKHKALSHGHIEKLEAQLHEAVQFLLNKAAQTDEQESENDLNLPAEIAHREQRLEALAAAITKIAERAQVRDQHVLKDFDEKVVRHQPTKGRVEITPAWTQSTDNKNANFIVNANTPSNRRLALLNKYQAFANSWCGVFKQQRTNGNW